MNPRPLLLLLAPLSLAAQNIPDEWHLSPDGRILYTGGLESGGFYREDTVRTIYLSFSQPDWWTQLENNYEDQIPIPATLSYNGDVYTPVGVRFKGSTSYFMLPPGTQKMSFDIDLNEYVPGQEINGYSTINLNNGFQDDSFMREVVYEHFIRRHIPSAKANYVKLVINGENWGPYLNVQGLNSPFIREWFFSNDGDRWRADRPPGAPPGPPGWGDGTAGLNYHGPDTVDYQDYYTLKDHTEPYPWDRLVKVCDELNNTPLPQLEDSLDKYMNIDRVLWHLASENAWADDDSYIYKGRMDYYLYWESESRRMTTIEYDGNTVMDGMHLNWSPFFNANDANYPLLNRLLAVPSLRQRYLAHLRTIIGEQLDATLTTQVTNDFKALIDTMVQNDDKKLMTYAEFNAGFTQLQNGITTRRNVLNANAEVAQVAPTISGTEHETSAGINMDPAAGEAVDVRTTVTSASGISSVTLCHSTTLWGRFVRTAMLDDGAHDDGAAGDGVYGASIPGNGAGTWVRYYIEAKAANAALSAMYDPVGAEHDVYVYNVAIPTAPATGVVVNEVMASNSITATDENGEFEDWIELYNNNGTQANVGLWFVSDTPFEPYKWRLPIGTSIPANGYLIIWCDDENDGDEHATFKLSSSGESVLLLNTDSLLVDEVTFGEQITDLGYARVPNGSGPFQVQTATFAANNNLVSGVGEVPAAGGLVVFPSPATTLVALAAAVPAVEEVEISDAMGRQMWRGWLGDRTQVDVSTWAAGTYLVRMGPNVTRFMVAH